MLFHVPKALKPLIIAAMFAWTTAAQAESYKEPETVSEIIDALKPPREASEFGQSPPPGTTRGLNFSTGGTDSTEESAVGATNSTGVGAADFQILFEINSFQLTKEAEVKLKKIGEALVSSDLNGYAFEIGGHTDSTGSSSYNTELSERRAGAVIEFLVERFGIDRQRLAGRGYGETKPRNREAPESSENRRVEVKNLGTL